MPEQAKRRTTTIVARELPMPAYRYQQPQQESFAVRNDSKTDGKRRSDEKTKLPALQSLCMGD